MWQSGHCQRAGLLLIYCAITSNVFPFQNQNYLKYLVYCHLPESKLFTIFQNQNYLKYLVYCILILLHLLLKLLNRAQFASTCFIFFCFKAPCCFFTIFDFIFNNRDYGAFGFILSSIWKSTELFLIILVQCFSNDWLFLKNHI